MPVCHRRACPHEGGFISIIVILVLIVVAIIGFSGYNVINLRQNSKQPDLSQHAGSTEFKPHDFASCVRAGGVVRTPGLPPQNTDYDYNTGTKHCTYNSFGGSVKIDDNSCNDQVRCDQIRIAAQNVCQQIPSVGPNASFKPTFKYFPVVEGDYAKLELTDCSPNGYKIDVMAVIFLKKIESQWAILTVAIGTTPCSAIDNLGIPLELADLCIDPNKGFRPPQ